MAPSPRSKLGNCLVPGLFGSAAGNQLILGKVQSLKPQNQSKRPKKFYVIHKINPGISVSFNNTNSLAKPEAQAWNET